ncbi:hypothetical protein [Persicitalea sp.]|uniref:hypothetical protein n=1 Tax=Persicitalea sp. TaxID=3100273 RepID=UPI00359435DB
MNFSISFAIRKIHDGLYTVKYSGSSQPELTNLFEKWNDPEYLSDFFEANEADLHSEFWHTALGQPLTIDKAIDDTIQQAEQLEKCFYKQEHESYESFNTRLNQSFVSLLKSEVYKPLYQSLNKAYKSKKGWLRIYALRIDTTYIVTGGAIKLTGKMEDRPHTQQQLDNLRNVAQLLKQNYFDSDTDFDSVYIEI